MTVLKREIEMLEISNRMTFFAEEAKDAQVEEVVSKRKDYSLQRRFTVV